MLISNTTIRFTAKEKQELEIIAKRRSRSISYIVREACDYYLKDIREQDSKTIAKLQDFARAFETKE